VNLNATATEQSESFNAYVRVHDTNVSIHAPTFDALCKTLTQLGYTPSQDLQLPLLPAAGEPEVKAQVQQTKPKKEAAAQVEKSSAAPSAAEKTGTPSPSADAATTATTPAATTTEKGPDYNDVKAAVLALAKISPQLAKDTLAKFKGQNGEPCDHGTKLPLESYADFLAAAKEAQGVAA
jgi:hypothetical protein